MDVPILLLLLTTYTVALATREKPIRFSMSWPWTWKTKNLQLLCTKVTKKCCQSRKMLAKVSQMLPSKVIGGSWGSSWSFPRPNAIRSMCRHGSMCSYVCCWQQLDIQNYFFPLLHAKNYKSKNFVKMHCGPENLKKSRQKKPREFK